MKFSTRKIAVSILMVLICFAYSSNGIAAIESPMESFTGNIFERGTNFQKLLFRFQRKITTKNSIKIVEAEYFDPAGKLVLEEKIQYRADGSMDTYWRMQHQIKEETKIQREGDKVLFHKNEKGKDSDDKETWQSNNLLTDQITDYVRANWDTLMKGKSVDIRLMVPSRTETVGFTVEKLEEEGKVNGKPAIIFEMTASSMIIRAIVDPIRFYYEKDEPKRTLMVDGRMPVKRMEKNGDYSDMEGQFVYDYVVKGEPATKIAEPQKENNQDQKKKEKKSKVI